MSPKVVAFTGYPACGKTTLSKFLTEKMGFVGLSGDDISVELFGHTYPYNASEDPERIWSEICVRRDSFIIKGKNVVIDTTAYNDFRRRQLLVPSSDRQNYLLWLQIKPETLEKRQIGRKWSPDSVEKWKKFVGWTEPKQQKIYRLIVYQNNSPEDLKKSKPL